MITDDLIDQFLQASERSLLSHAARVRFSDISNFPPPESGGVYAFSYGLKLIYIGETTNLKQRLMVHMRNPENHVVALKLSRALFRPKHNLESNGTKKQKKFDKTHIMKCNKWISDNLFFSFVSLKIGRAELEEMLVRKHHPPFNSRDPRLPRPPLQSRLTIRSSRVRFAASALAL